MQLQLLLAVVHPARFGGDDNDGIWVRMMNGAGVANGVLDDALVAVAVVVAAVGVVGGGAFRAAKTLSRKTPLVTSGCCFPRICC